MKIDTTTEVLTRTGRIALAGKVFKEIGLDFTSDAILSRADKQIIKGTSKKRLEVSVGAWMHPHFWGEMP